MSALISYVKNIVVKNKLATNDEFEKVIEYLNDNTESNILKALIKFEIVNKEQALKMKKGYESLKNKKKQKVIDKRAEDTSDLAPPPLDKNYVKINEDKTGKIEAKLASGIGNELSAILSAAREEGASDVHIVAKSRPMARINGALVTISEQIITKEKAKELIYSGMTETQIQEFEQNKNIEYCLVLDEKDRYRTCVVNQHSGYDGAYRIINNEIPTLEKLGLPVALDKLTKFATGIIFLTGPSGCGKSSTMAALIELINKDREDHIITLEDPIEYVYESKRCHVSQRQLKDHTESFTNALRGALREDPDIIILGEMRDYETASLALSAAETGHLVMTTLHTTSAVKTIERVLDMFPPNQVEQIRAMLSKSLRAVICQKLIPTKDNSKRVPALEIMYNNNAITNLISMDKMISVPSTIQTAKSEGMCLLDNSIEELLNKDIITQENAQKFADDRKKFLVRKGKR